MTRHTVGVAVIMVPRSRLVHYWPFVREEGDGFFNEVTVWEATHTVCGRRGPPRHGRVDERLLLDRPFCRGCRDSPWTFRDVLSPELLELFPDHAESDAEESRS